METNEQYLNAGGYGFWCSKKCAAAKVAAGIPPIGGQSAKKQKAAADKALAEAAMVAASRQDQPDAWTPKATTTLIVASMASIALIVVIARLVKKRK